MKATTTIKQVLNYQADHGAWFAANNEHGTAQERTLRMDERLLDIPCQLRFSFE